MAQAPITSGAGASLVAFFPWTLLLTPLLIQRGLQVQTNANNNVAVDPEKLENMDVGSFMLVCLLSVVWG